MIQLFSQQRFLAIAAGCLIAFTTSSAWAQLGGRQQSGGQAQGGAGAGGEQGGGIGEVGGTTQPSGAVTGEISRSADRVLADGGERAGAARGGMPGGVGGAGGMGGMGGMGMGGFGGMNPFGANPFGANGAAAETPSVRTRLRSAIQTPARSPQVVNARVQRRITTNAPIQRRVNGLSVSVLDGVATISGTASSARDRRMAELVLRLEPGVRQIDNQIVVAP